MCFWSRQSAFGVNLYYLCDITFAAYVKVWGKLKFLGQVWEGVVRLAMTVTE